jgi:hypothetical protein
MTNLASVSTYGWFTGESEGQQLSDALEPVSTYGWWLEVITLGRPDIILFDLYIRETDLNDMYVKKSAEWPLER